MAPPPCRWAIILSVATFKACPVRPGQTRRLDLCGPLPIFPDQQTSSDWPGQFGAKAQDRKLDFNRPRQQRSINRHQRTWARLLPGALPPHPVLSIYRFRCRRARRSMQDSQPTIAAERCWPVRKGHRCPKSGVCKRSDSRLITEVEWIAQQCR